MSRSIVNGGASPNFQLAAGYALREGLAHTVFHAGLRLAVLWSCMLTRPDLLLRIEALTVLLASMVCYSALHGRWVLFAASFLAPDLSLLGYLAGNRHFAAGLYNAVHNYAGPLALGLLAWESRSLGMEWVAVIWVAHIAFDRLLGFGLKYSEAFQPTHIQSARFFRSS